MFVALVGPIVYSNVSEKLETGSGNARVGDFAIATAVMQEHPWVGIDIENLTKICWLLMLVKMLGHQRATKRDTWSKEW